MIDIETLEVIATLVEVGALDEAKEWAADLIDHTSPEDLCAVTDCTDILDSYPHSVAVAKLRAQWHAETARRDIITYCVAESDDRRYDPARQAEATHSDKIEKRFDQLAARVEDETLVTVDDWRKELWKLDRLATRDPHPVATRDEQQTRSDAVTSRQYRDATPRDLRDTAPSDVQRATAAYVHTLAPELRRKPRPDAVEPKDVTDYLATFRSWYAVEEREPRDLDDSLGYAIDYDHAAERPFHGTPCVSCWTERMPRENAAGSKLARHDDGLCSECRERGHHGITPERITHARTHTRRRLSAHANRTAADLVAPCAAVAQHYPPAAAMNWARAYWHTHRNRRPFVQQWATEHFAPAPAAVPATPQDIYRDAASAALRRSADRRTAERHARAFQDALIARRAELADTATQCHADEQEQAPVAEVPAAA
jgi:hypothetical protein